MPEDLQGVPAELQSTNPDSSGPPLSTPPSPEPASSGAPAPTDATQPSPSIRDILATFGYQGASQYQSDIDALRAAAQAAQSSQQYNHYVNEYIQNAGAFRQWQDAQRQAQQQSLHQQQPSWWKAPEFDPSWQQKIYRDQQGNLQVLPGADPSIIQKYNAWVDHQQRFLNDFSRDPINSIKPGIEQIVQQAAGSLFQNYIAQIQEQAVAANFIQQNSEWLHERDANGNVLMDQRSGRPALSGLGRQFANYVREAESFGLNDSNSQQKYAMAALQRDFLIAKMQQQPNNNGTGIDPTSSIKQNYLQQAAGLPNNTPATPPQNTNGNYQTAQSSPVRVLQEMLSREFASNGMNPGQPLVMR